MASVSPWKPTFDVSGIGVFIIAVWVALIDIHHSVYNFRGCGLVVNIDAIDATYFSATTQYTDMVASKPRPEPTDARYTPIESAK